MALLAVLEAGALKGLTQAVLEQVGKAMLAVLV
jgi:hypothetical protein